MKTKQIEYLDATPAAGKTREARRLMANHLTLGSGTSIFVYAAPTHNLLDEVAKSLRDVVGRDEYDAMVVQIYPSRNPVIQYSYLMGLVDERAAKKLLDEEDFLRLRSLKPACRAILCTHECLVQAIRGSTTETETATVVFDEARNCVLRDLEVKVSRQAVEKISKVFDLISMETQKEVIIDGKAYQSTMSSLTAKGFPKSADLMKAFGVDAMIDLPSYVSSLYGMKEVCAGGRADILIEVLVPKTKGTDQKAYIVGLSRPSSIFEGYGRVIVMSAYFMHSQMYHLLLNAHIGHQRGEHIFKLVPYAAGTDFDRMSKTITENSLKNIRIGALLKNTRSGKLTSTFLSSGLVVTPPLQQAIRERCKLKKGEVIKAAFAKESVPGLTEKENKVLHACANPPLLVLHRLAYEALKEKAKTALCFTNAFGSTSYGSTYRIGTEEVMNTVDFMMNVPISLLGSHYKKQRKYVTKPMITHLAEVTAKQFYVVPRSTSVLGLNSYDHLSAFVHLAALNPKPAVARVLKRVLPNYEPDLDYAISNIIQTMYRTSLRNPKSRDEVYCLVTTEWIIEQIERVCFAGQSLRRIPGYEPKFTELNFALQDREAKSRAGKANSLDVPDDVKKEMAKLKRGAKEVSVKTLKKKMESLRVLANQYPALTRNVTNWINRKTRELM